MLCPALPRVGLVVAVVSRQARHYDKAGIIADNSPVKPLVQFNDGSVKRYSWKSLEYCSTDELV